MASKRIDPRAICYLCNLIVHLTYLLPYSACDNKQHVMEGYITASLDHNPLTIDPAHKRWHLRQLKPHHTNLLTKEDTENDEDFDWVKHQGV
jgi:hypothetical protein